jgi:hypothetical protein
VSGGRPDAFAALRGDFPPAALNARRIASSLDVPGCNRRAVLDAACVDINKLAKLLTGEDDRQSPFTITRGNQFEEQVVADGMSSVIQLVRDHLGFTIPEVRQRDLSAAAIREQTGLREPHDVLAYRAWLTRQHLERMLRGEDDAHNLLRHPVTCLSIGGETAWLEQDVLAFAVAGHLGVVEIKSFASIDGRPDPDKVSAALRQSAVYVLSVQQLAAELGFGPDVISTKVLLILPRNLGFVPVGLAHDVEMQVARLRRQIAAVPRVSSIVRSLPEGLALPALPPKNAPAAEVRQARSAAADVVSSIAPRFGDGCTPCPMFKVCRGEAERHHLVSRLGNDVANSCGSVSTIDRALALADGDAVARTEAERALQDVLGRGAAAARLFLAADG